MEGGTSRTVEDAAVVAQPLDRTPGGEALNDDQQKMLADLQAAERARQDQIARIKDQNCQRSRDVLDRLTLKSRIRVKGEDGEYRVMGEDERQERIAKAQEGIALYCVPA